MEAGTTSSGATFWLTDPDILCEYSAVWAVESVSEGFLGPI